ncbi:putative homing endonuclease [Sinorhizobium phage phiM7]|uniref:HNH DNase n=3 Tax=Emdodecavirus TaxID=1980937 RepID=A0A0F6WCH8_9CAUD|nr:putative homing endonuclease [Sinorhizobium phage phiM12]YP_009212365.1 HNH DNase [Sinorhizobium phage phiN3]YP_009601236.1 putative homing endonuclease [Sinorhizobium phage phiM7]AKF13018.1 putative homing endonuclease [Sinorhizobium phage phiM19]AGR47802.1 putative homing endonuclease [Sinorhizobium phage phiM12]AKF12658.1 putative homing endonuclease [Sinorhizobium phage phiM7]AKF13390.1 HNH DNase [Sinorhizobium phage phiN3]
MRKFGFVYIWYDRKHKLYYIGSHWGHLDDGYICSSTRMRNAYKRRPTDFRRKILTLVYTNRSDLLDMEQRWFDVVKRKDRYYNINFKVHDLWWTDPLRGMSVKAKLSAKRRARPNVPFPEEGKAKLRKTHTFHSPSNELITVTNLPKFCEENDLHYVAMTKLSKGTYGRPSYKGWSKA